MQNIILIGFMGTGKSTIGRALANRLGMNHVDMDEQIVQREGQPISVIFSEKGELYFRDLESEVLRDLVSGSNQVITTGGGAVLRAANVELMLKHGRVIALDASEEEIVRRVGNDPSRPLLAGDIAQRVRTLKRERAKAYDFAPIQIDTTGKTVEQILDEIDEWMDKLDR